jgi:aminopeptidase
MSVAIDCVEFARLLTKEAYLQGARYVTVRFHDEKITRLHYDNCPVELFEAYPEWLALLNNSMAQKGAAILSVISEDPFVMVGIDPTKPATNTRAAHEACKEFYRALDSGKLSWCIVGAAAPAWATVVFPDLSPEEAYEKLWDSIFTATRVDQLDPIAAWENHRQGFSSRKVWLNDQKFVALHLTNSLGTDLTVKLNDQGIWQGIGDVTSEGIPFFPNMPTEEVFTTPHRLGTEGVVFSSMPLIHHGNLVENFSLTFENGRVISYHAEVGNDVLTSIFNTDERSGFLGEVALVPFSSPIRQTGILFYNTLFDENAACHLAVGQGFSDCLIGGCEMSEDDLVMSGVNQSATHVDFMIGTHDLSIYGINIEGSKVPIFHNGEWV